MSETSFIDADDNRKIAHECICHGSVCCKKGKLFVPDFEYNRIIRFLKMYDWNDDLTEFESRCEKCDGYYLYDQKNACQFLDEQNLCRIHFSVKPSECFWWPLHVFYDKTTDKYSLMAGTYCCDACNYIKGDSQHARMVETQAKHMGLDLIKKFRERFPGKEGAYRFIRDVDMKSHSGVVGSSEFETLRGAYRSLGAKYFSEDLIYSNEEVSFIKSPSHFFSGFIRDDKLVSCCDVVLVSKQEFLDFQEGRLDEDKLYGGDLFNQESYIYINALILLEECHSAFLYRQLFKDVQKFCDEHETNPSHVFAISTNEKVHRLMISNKFEEVGLYRDKYPILLLDRKKSLALHSLLPSWSFDPRDSC